MWQGVLRPWVPRLVAWAREGRAPEWTAETIGYEIPVGYHGAVRTAVSALDIADVVREFPALAPFAVWLRDVLAALTAVLTVDEGVSDDDDAAVRRGPGDRANVAADAAPGPARVDGPGGKSRGSGARR